MRFGKPTYDNGAKIYKCEVKEGIRCETVVESGTFTPPLDSFLPAWRQEVCSRLIEQTKGWFSKPLDMNYVSQRLTFAFPPLELAQDFEGTLAWEAKELLISKTNFNFRFELVEKKEAEKVVIDFPEPEQEEDQGRRIRQLTSLSREEHKEYVMREREKAARYLFRAERLTHEYCKIYGDDTDWEEDSDESEEESSDLD